MQALSVSRFRAADCMSANVSDVIFWAPIPPFLAPNFNTSYHYHTIISLMNTNYKIVIYVEIINIINNL